MLDVTHLLFLLINSLSLAILASVVISWLRFFGLRISYSNPVVRIIQETADLILRPIRRAIPTAAGGMDFSPVVAILLLQIARAVLVQVFYGR